MLEKLFRSEKFLNSWIGWCRSCAKEYRKFGMTEEADKCEADIETCEFLLLEAS